MVMPVLSWHALSLSSSTLPYSSCRPRDGRTRTRRSTQASKRLHRCIPALRQTSAACESIIVSRRGGGKKVGRLSPRALAAVMLWAELFSITIRQRE